MKATFVTELRGGMPRCPSEQSPGEAWGRERGGGGAALGAAGLKIVWIDRKFKIDTMHFLQSAREVIPQNTDTPAPSRQAVAFRPLINVLVEYYLKL